MNIENVKQLSEYKISYENRTFYRLVEKSFDETAIINWYILEDGIEMYLDDEESLKLESIFYKCVN